MTRWILAAGAAALAITAPVAAQKGGHGGDKEHGEQAKAGKGGGQKADRGNRGGGNDKATRGSQRMERQKFVQRDEQKARGRDKSEAKQDRGNDRAEKADRANRGNDKVRV